MAQDGDERSAGRSSDAVNARPRQRRAKQAEKLLVTRATESVRVRIVGEIDVFEPVGCHVFEDGGLLLPDLVLRNAGRGRRRAGRDEDRPLTPRRAPSTADTTALTTEKIAVLAPMPSVSVSRATAAKPG